MKKDSFSRLMLGTVQFGLNYGVANTHGKPSFELVKDLLRYAFDHGVTALDTAPEYGDSEEVIGRALRELGLSEEFGIVTKIPAIPAETDPVQFMEDSLRKSLKNLQIDCIPVALLHTENDVCHIEQLRSMIGKGLIRGAGVSLNTLEYENKADPLEYLQIPCNAMDHRFDRLFTVPRKRNFIRSAYLQGLLLMPEEQIFLKELIPYREKLESLGLPMAELCMRYLFSLPGNNSILTGVDTLEQLKENIRLADLGPLPSELFEKVSRCVSLLPEMWISPYFWNRYKQIHGIPTKSKESYK